MAADQTQFEAILSALMSPDNATRTQTEQAYEQIPTPTKLQFLINTIRNSDTSIENRSLANVLLRRLFSNSFEEFWPSLSRELQEAIKRELMLAVQEELTPPVRKKVCDAVAELARNLIDEENNMLWPEVLKFMFECANSPDAGLRESALHIFSSVPGIFGNQQAHYLDVIKQMLGQCLQDRANPPVWFEAIKATSAFLLANDKEPTVLAHCKDLLPGVVQGLTESVNQQTDDGIFKCLIELAESVPKFLRPQLDVLIPFCLKVVSDANLDNSWRQLGLEALVALAESAPAMIRKFGKYIPLLVPQVLALMVDLEDDKDWSLQDDQEDEDTDSNAIAGESALDRLACALGGKTMLPHIIANVSQMLPNEDWRYRHAALMAISACGEGCHTQMEAMLNTIMEAILPYLRDPHPRVRYAACNAIGQMCTDFGPTLQKLFHGRIVVELLAVMDDHGNPRVQAHGAAALVNFSEDCPKLILVTYLDLIIDKLEQVLTGKFKELLERGTKMVLEQAVTTLASVADTSEDKFVKYYDRFMPILKYIVQNATGKELRLLRGKTIECISLIGLAVGKEKFGQDCDDVMQLLLKTQTEQVEEMADDDPQISYMISAWARMCKILGKEFQKYLPLVMTPVLKAASLKPEVALIDSDEMKSVENDTDWHFITLGDQQSFGIRTAGLEEKATACQMLVCYARELKEAFSEYTEEVVKLMVPLLKFYFNDEVRVAASESLPFLIDCARIRGQQYLAEMWNFICPNLIKAIEVEPEPSVLPEHLNSMSKCIEKLGKGCLTDQHMAELISSLDKLLGEHFKRQDERAQKRNDEDYDEVLEESLLEEDDEDVYVLSKIADILHSFFGTHKEEFLPMFEQIMPFFVKLLSPDRPWQDRQWALCVWDDVIEHTGPISMNYQQYFLQNMISYLLDKVPDVRQAAEYGVGVIAQFGGNVYAEACAQALPSLIKVIEDPESKKPGNLHATDNAISAVTKICKYNASKVNVDEIIPRLIWWMPVTDDEDEAEHVYSYLCDLLSINHPGVLGELSENLPRIVAVIAEVLYKEVFDSSQEVYAKLLAIIEQIKSNDQVFQLCVNGLTPEQKEALSEALEKC
ncbi:importin-5-like [Gigantopelta aegis]|uniref:importin-5-like n=1 Tax=Gigantopelta aegis TaxID=1735272 RepID=UPI001B887E1E|nr:importin-5-like [Gigantopelta aegis]